jgi:hypothetical protein
MTKATITAAIDWDNTGTFLDGVGENVTTYVQHHPGIVCERGRDQVRSLAPPMAGQCSFTLRNPSTNKLFSPDYTAGTLYGNLLPGRPVRVQADGSDLWRGFLDDLPQQPWVRGGPQAGGLVQAPSLGLLSKLRGKQVYTDLYTSITTDTAIGYLFNALGLLSKLSILDTGKTTLTAWWCQGDDAFTMLTQLLAAEGPGAAIYETANGLVAFHSRHYRLTNSRCTTSQATFGNASTEPKHSAPFGYQPNLKGVVNDCGIDVKTLAIAGATSTLWTYGGGTVELGPGVAQAFDVVLSTPAQGALSVNLTIATSTGSGSMASTLTRYNPATGAYVTANSGTHFRVTVTNNTTGTVTLSAITLDGKAGTVTTDRAAQRTSVSASQGKYGVQSLPTNWAPWPYIALGVAQDFCDAIVTTYQEPRATVTITVKNANATRLAQQLARDISDRVTVVEDQSGINAPVYIERIKHTITEGGLFHTTEFGCEKASTQSDWFRWDTSVWDTGRWGF